MTNYQAPISRQTTKTNEQNTNVCSLVIVFCNLSVIWDLVIGNSLSVIRNSEFVPLHTPVLAGELFDGNAPEPHLGEQLGIEFPLLAGIMLHDLVHGSHSARLIRDLMDRAKPDHTGKGLTPLAGQLIVPDDTDILLHLKTDARVGGHVLDLHTLSGGVEINGVAIIPKRYGDKIRVVLPG